MASQNDRIKELLYSGDESLTLGLNDGLIFSDILKLIIVPEQTDRVIKFVRKVKILPSSGDIVKTLAPLLLPNGSVKSWMIACVEKEDESGLNVWKEIVRLLGKNLHQPGDGTVLLNSLLHVAEKAFKHASTSVRNAAYKAWMVLMDNFATNHTVLTSKKRVKLIVRPLLVSSTLVSFQTFSRLLNFYHAKTSVINSHLCSKT